MPLDKAIQLVINADDYGLLPSVNDSILEVYAAGNLTSTTLMVNMPGTEDAVSKASAYPGLSFGLHFCLTEGKPLTKCTTLVDASGHFLRRSKLIRKSVLGQVDRAEIQAEFIAQLAAFAETGLALSHVDSHQHVHMAPGIFAAIYPVLRARNLPVRLIRPLPLQQKRGLSKQLKNLVLSANARRIGRAPGIRSNDYLTSIHDLPDPEYRQTESYARLLAAATKSMVLELMVHPYLESKDLKQLYSDYESHLPFLQRCFWEYAALKGKPLFTGSELTLTTFQKVFATKQ